MLVVWVIKWQFLVKEKRMLEEGKCLKVDIKIGKANVTEIDEGKTSIRIIQQFFHFTLG